MPAAAASRFACLWRLFFASARSCCAPSAPRPSGKLCLGAPPRRRAPRHLGSSRQSQPKQERSFCFNLFAVTIVRLFFRPLGFRWRATQEEGQCRLLAVMLTSTTRLVATQRRRRRGGGGPHPPGAADHVLALNRSWLRVLSASCDLLLVRWSSVPFAGQGVGTFSGPFSVFSPILASLLLPPPFSNPRLPPAGGVSSMPSESPHPSFTPSLTFFCRRLPAWLGGAPQRRPCRGQERRCCRCQICCNASRPPESVDRSRLCCEYRFEGDPRPHRCG